MKALDLRKLSMSELQNKIKELEKNFFSAVCNASVATVNDISVLKKSRRLIARAKTILNEKTKDETNSKTQKK